MNIVKVLVSGLGFGHEFDLCEKCWVDFSWLIHNPSVLLWADKIIFPEYSFKEQLKQEDDKLDKAINSVLNIANDNKLIEFSDVRNIYTDKVSEMFFEQAKVDRDNLLSHFRKT